MIVLPFGCYEGLPRVRTYRRRSQGCPPARSLTHSSATHGTPSTCTQDETERRTKFSREKSKMGAKHTSYSSKKAILRCDKEGDRVTMETTPEAPLPRGCNAKTRRTKGGARLLASN